MDGYIEPCGKDTYWTAGAPEVVVEAADWSHHQPCQQRCAGTRQSTLWAAPAWTDCSYLCWYLLWIEWMIHLQHRP